MATNTYVALDKTVTTSSATTLTWSSIPSGYTDLFIVGYCKAVAPGGATFLRFNGDSATNYSRTRILGTGSSASSVSVPNETKIAIDAPNTEWSNFTVNVQNYSNNTTYKTALNRANSSDYVTAQVGTWRNTAAITSITLTIDGGSFADGSTFSLYGIKAWADESSPKATGGYVTSDDTYWYHSFPSSSTFTPNQSITADCLVTAGGGGGGSGGGGSNDGAGGGAGGFRVLTSQSLVAQSYTITVGGGGTSGSGARGGVGTNSSMAGTSFTTITASGGGGGATTLNTTGIAGGSGGGAAGTAGGTGTIGAGNVGSYSPVEGFAGGLGASDGATYDNAGGGGGAAAVGVAANSVGGGNGGAGSNTYSSWASATSTGVSGYYAGGGGGAGLYAKTAGAGGAGGGGAGSNGNGNNATAGIANSAGGGGGGGVNGIGGAGGSGIVIVRYAKV